MPMRLVLRAWTDLVYVDMIGLAGFKAVRRSVRRTHTSARSSTPQTVSQVVAALEIACTWYVRPTRCLLRSAVVTRLLRREGVQADMIIGCHPAPLRAHAWVTVADKIVSDDLDGVEYFHILEKW
jgi:hypothetical protein